MQHFYLLLMLLPRFRIHLALHKFLFALQFSPIFHALRIQLAVRNRRLHRATRFAGVPAVAILALRRKFLDIGERPLQALRCAPQLQFAQSWRIDEQCPTRQREQFALLPVCADGRERRLFGPPTKLDRLEN